MRMRRKSNLFERLERCKNTLLYLENEDFYLKKESEKLNIFNLEQIFGNTNPLLLEIGCGKGQFALETARRNLDKNLIAVEKISNVIITACENAEVENPKNCKFLNCSAENLLYYIPKNKFERIFLNFSCP